MAAREGAGITVSPSRSIWSCTMAETGPAHHMVWRWSPLSAHGGGEGTSRRSLFPVRHQQRSGSLAVFGAALRDGPVRSIDQDHAWARRLVFENCAKYYCVERRLAKCRPEAAGANLGVAKSLERRHVTNDKTGVAPWTWSPNEASSHSNHALPTVT